MRWIPIAEVEVLIGKRERNARYWLERHAIPARGERPRLFAEAAILTKLAELGQAHRKPPEHPPEYVPEYPPEATGMPPERTGKQSAEPIEAAYQVTPAVVEQAIARTGQQYTADLRAMLAELRQVYEGQVLAQAETIAAKDQVIATQAEALAELRRRAEAAEADAATLRERASAPVAAQGEASGDRGDPEALDAQKAAGEGLWGRVRRWWARET